MSELNRRGFLIGLLGTAVVVAAGPLPTVIEQIPEKDFFNAVRAVMPAFDEIYGNGKDYAFPIIEYLDEAPYFKVKIPEGYRPLREESNRIAQQVMSGMKL